MTAAGLLRASAAAVAAEVRALPADVARRRPAAGTWCPLEVVGHLIETEQHGFAGRIRQLIENDRPRLAAWSPPEVAAARRDCERDPEALVRDLLDRREESVGWLESLTPADLVRHGEHPEVGRLTAGDVMHEWVHHDRAHLKQLLELTQAFAWPDMGNARRFSAP